MNLKINIKARLKRYYQNQININRKKAIRVVKKFKIFWAILVLLFPIYPSFGSFAYDQWAAPDYDPNTILSSYDDLSWDPTSNFSNESWFIKPGDVNLDSRDLSWINKLVIYKVESWDSLESIANKYWIDVKSIQWTNFFNDNTVLHPGQEIKIPPVSGFVYTVEAWDYIDSIAKKFGVEKAKIIEQNKLEEWKDLQLWQVIVIPGWKKIIKVQEETKTETKVVKKDDKKPKVTETKKKPTTPKVVAKKPTQTWYAVEYRWTGWNKFAPGYCTWFVANYKKVTWRWNAWEWLRNASAAWVPTWSTAANWSIVVFKWRGYNSYYGHVWIVVWVEWDSIIVKDMNYARKYQVTIRKVSKNDSSIRGYIYAN